MDLTQLYEQQVRDFELARINYEHLKNVVYRTVHFPDFNIRLQYNPARMISTNAKIDATTLLNRKCFLCPEQMPKEQKGIAYGDRYHIFINPYPIFDKHFTVPASDHTPQLICGRFEDLLSLTFDFPEYTTFYNGPSCGASAPDHFHFQMVPRHRMPLEEDIDKVSLREYILQKEHYSLSTLNRYRRNILLLQGTDRQLLSRLYTRIQKIVGEEIPYEEEPMMNLLAWFEKNQWTICIFPRKTRRPWQFYAEGKEQVLFSPGCVDMAGLIIAPRREDFDRYSEELLTDLFRQVCAEKEDWDRILQRLKE
ncbi:MAG: DUF4922 domain-containing protein [Odoribacter sp.]